MPFTGLSSTTTAMSCGSLCAWLYAGSPCQVPQYVLPFFGSYVDSNVPATRDTPSSQCSAVKKTVGEISVPVHSSQVPSENACCASSAPTSGWPFPSGTPYVIAAVPAANTSKDPAAARAANNVFLNFSSPFLGHAQSSARFCAQAVVSATCSAASRSSSHVRSFTRGRPSFSPAARSSSSMLAQPVYSTACTPLSARTASTASAVTSSRCARRPASTSSRRSVAVSVASFLFVPMIPVGPRLIQPAQ